MSSQPAVKSAVEQERVVVACAYDTHLPAELSGQLPADRKTRSYVARIVDGRVVSVATGAPEDVIAGQLGAP
ncbi:MAG: hypothetical protein IT463_06440 [Planctomycetes bacterium]|nr:hypothetical protein [Planctomycetota bacterium]